ncbi:hypothetical protein ACSNN7_08945 [Micromonospora sp. URMC 105]|uniref:hypothetical protein n=1 Tax=Micromonospora sp. URMC 105 TaxID=3423413 RepID=UPI003F19D8AC
MAAIGNLRHRPVRRLTQLYVGLVLAIGPLAQLFTPLFTVAPRSTPDTPVATLAELR